MTFSDVKTAAVVIAAAVAAVTAILGLVSALRKERDHHNEPLTRLSARVDQHDTWFAADKRRLEQLEADRDALKSHNEEQDEQSGIIIRSQLAMLRHMQHGNNVDGMRRSETEITDWLTRRGA